jgi:hypothetical protein
LGLLALTLLLLRTRHQRFERENAFASVERP